MDKSDDAKNQKDKIIAALIDDIGATIEVAFVNRETDRLAEQNEQFPLALLPPLRVRPASTARKLRKPPSVNYPVFRSHPPALSPLHSSPLSPHHSTAPLGVSRRAT